MLDCMWIYFALMTPFFWALVHLADSHCVEEIFEKPWMGVVTSALASMVIYLAIPIFLPFISVETPPLSILFLAFLAGSLIQISQAFYFQSLSYTEAGIVAAYWNMTPAFLPLFSYFFFKEILNIPEYIGIGILIFSSVSLCLLDSNFKTRWNSFFLMLLASLLQVIALLLEDKVFEQTTYLIGFYAITSGLIFTGALPLLFKKVRETFRKNAHRVKPAVKIFLIVEIFNLCALATSQKAIDLGNPSLVAAVETSVPAYTFILSLILLGFSSRFGDIETWKKLPLKLTFVATMIVGVYLVSN